MTQLLDKIIFITGGASGIGRSAALTFGHAGATVIISDINQEAGEETAALVKQETGATAHFLWSDVSSHDSVKSVIDHIITDHGRIDIAINNAGVEGETNRTADVTEQDFDWIMQVNVKGVWLCMKYELPQMVKQGGGVILNTASVAGLVGAHSLPVYSASKHAVIGLTKSAALEYARKNIRVNAVCPSMIRTPMVERAFENLPQFENAVINGHPSRRLGEASEVAAALLWLASPQASFINGVALPVDGAFTAQ